MQAGTDADRLSQWWPMTASKDRARHAAAVMFLDHAIDNSRSGNGFCQFSDAGLVFPRSFGFDPQLCRASLKFLVLFTALFNLQLEVQPFVRSGKGKAQVVLAPFVSDFCFRYSIAASRSSFSASSSCC